jgi:hypothetical protein
MADNITALAQEQQLEQARQDFADETTAQISDETPTGLSELIRPLSAIAEDADLSTIEGALRIVSEGARDLDPLGRALLREAAIKELRRHKAAVASPAKLVDAALGGGPKAEDDKQGTQVVLSVPEPWPDPVDGAELLDDITMAYRRFVVLPDGGAEALSLWVLYTYVYDAFDVSPRIGFTSPTKRCGKTTALDVTEALVQKPLPTSNITAAALFRTVEAFRPTLLIDEADTFLKDKDDLRGLLNAGHYRRSAMVIRTVGEDFEPRGFSVWAPAAVALIGKLPDTLADRSVEVRMRRRTRTEKVEKLRLDRIAELEPLRQRAARWAADNEEALRGADPSIPDGLHDRAADNWRPLLAIADLVGGNWPQRARGAACTLNNLASEDGDHGPKLLADIYLVFEQEKADKLFTEDLLNGLLDMDESPWRTWNRGAVMSARQLADQLRAFDIRSKTVRIGKDTKKGYAREAFGDTWKRYPPPTTDEKAAPNPPPAPDTPFQSVTASQSLNHAENGAFPSVTHGVSVTDEKPLKSPPLGHCDAVTDQNPLPGKGYALTEEDWRLLS